MENVQPTWKVRIVNGRIVSDETTDLPEGAVFEVQKVDKLDVLTPEQADELRRSFERGGEIPAAELLARLRR